MLGSERNNYFRVTGHLSIKKNCPIDKNLYIILFRRVVLLTTYRKTVKYICFSLELVAFLFHQYLFIFDHPRVDDYHAGGSGGNRRSTM